MSQELDVEKDPFLVLLTDALRAGPASPEWHEAVARLKTGGDEVDEFRLLIEARDALESGRDYRSVRAGPGFTRKLLDNIDQQQSGGTRARRLPTANVIALLAGLVIVVVIAIVAYELYPRGAPKENGKAVEELAATFLSGEVLSSSFDDGIPVSWRKIGGLPLLASSGLKPGEGPAGQTIGAGIVSTEPLAPDQTFAIQVALRVEGRSADLIPQVFVAAGSDFSPDRGTSASELVWQLRDSEQSVVVGEQYQARRPIHRQAINVRISFNRTVAIVEADGQRIWAGPHALGDKSRYVGVRFLEPSGHSNSTVSVQSIRVLKTGA